MLYRHALVAKSLQEKLKNVCTTRVEAGLSQCKNFADKGGGDQFFAICADVFYGWPLGFSNKYFNV